MNVIAGSGVTRYGEAFTGALAGEVRRAPRYCDVPRAACLAHEARRELESRGPSDLRTLEPMYLRPSDAKLPT